MIELLSDPNIWVSFLTLTLLELVLGIDNVIFISILVDKLPQKQREFARLIGLGLAMAMRIGLLFVVSWLIALTAPMFTAFGQEISGRDLILIGGGLFLIWKSTREIHHMFDIPQEQAAPGAGATFGAIIVQIILIDMIFSLDSIITAVGMVDEIEVIVAAVVTSVVLMVLFAPHIGRFVSAHPPVKMIALSFLVVIGVVLIADGFDYHVPKGYIYFSLAFAVIVESLNIATRRGARRKPDA
ncbi:MAG TPA: TerC family protein [Burkholderiales bacterium]|nr:TerC family protein [Burkholderiales bacterium]